MPTLNRRVSLNLTPALTRSLRVLGLTPEIDPDSGVAVDGATQITSALARYAEAIDRAGRELDQLLDRQEWNLMADVLNGCADIWEWSETPMSSLLLIRAEVEDGHRLDRAGDKWFGEELEPGSGDKATKALLGKLGKLTTIHGDAIMAAIRYFWRCPEIDHTEHCWWTVAFRTRAETLAEAKARGNR